LEDRCSAHLLYRDLIVAMVPVAIERSAISWIRYYFYRDTPPLSAIFRVILGGVSVFLTGILIGVA
jgi:hypothetical protein